MIKLVALAEKHRNLSKEAFRDYWIHTHAPLAARIPGLLGYRINIAGDAGRLPAAPYDGSAELWFADHAAMEAGLGSKEGETAMANKANFTARCTFLVSEEHVVL